MNYTYVIRNPISRVSETHVPACRSCDRVPSTAYGLCASRFDPVPDTSTDTRTPTVPDVRLDTVATAGTDPTANSPGPRSA